MRKSAHPGPNLRLKNERELRGWSQKYVADQIGADHYYLSRWERGTASPSPYYRRKLCTLFGKDARELGLIAGDRDEPEDSSAADSQQVVPVQPLAAPPIPDTIYDPTIPLPAAGAVGLVGRHDMLRRLKQRLCNHTSVVLTALNGLPGVGKTTLAVILAHDQDVRDHFSDGVLWSGLGPHPNVPALLGRWGTLLGLASTEVNSLTSIESWVQALHTLLGDRRMLLVIDDAWEIDDALAFKIGGPHCAYLVTTRFPHIALRFASEGATLVRELSEDEGVELLARLAPEVVAQDSEAARVLVQSVGGLPLALTIIGKYLRLQSHSGQPRRIRAAIERLQNVEERLRLVEPQAFLEKSPSLPVETPMSLSAVIEVGDHYLDEQARAGLRALAVFPAKPNSFSEEAALAISNGPVEMLDRLTDAGMLEGSGPERYTLHQTIADYAKAHLNDVSAYHRMVGYFVHYVELHEGDYDALNLSDLANAVRHRHRDRLSHVINAPTCPLIGDGQGNRSSNILHVSM
jgi:transcriptional regulator with XRE-family HTH domain